MALQYKSFKAYANSIILICSIVAGGFVGYWLGPKSYYLKPFGDLFLNLILTAMVPLIFFSIAAAIARTNSAKLGKIIFSLLAVFLFTGLLASFTAVLVVKLFPPAKGIFLSFSQSASFSEPNISSQLVGIFSVSDFSQLLSHQHILPLIIFSILVGLAVASSANKGQSFLHFLDAGQTIFMRVFELIMYYAPIGFFAYFAVLVSELGPKLMQNYLRIAVLYYSSSLLYFILAFSVYAYLAGGAQSFRLFWKHLFLPSVTAVATCSSAASIPANLAAAKKMKIPTEIYETVVPLGAMIHKDGSVIGGIFKIAFLFGIFHLDFNSSAMLIAVGASLVVGVVMGAIPSGGMLGELFILAIYGFPPSVLIAVAAISIIADPLATLLNVTGDCAAAMLTARLVEGKSWLDQKKLR